MLLVPVLMLLIAWSYAPALHDHAQHAAHERVALRRVAGG